MANMEALIHRAAAALSFVSEKEVFETFVADGVEPSMAFLAVKAGSLKQTKSDDNEKA